MVVEVATDIEGVKGFQVAGIHAGLKKNDVLDFALIVSDTPCIAAGVFTVNQVKAAPVLLDIERIQGNSANMRVVVINSKCANACTGEQGMANARETARLVAEKIGCNENDVLVMSTGVIGTQLPMDKIRHGVEIAAYSLGSDWSLAARAIMTTDTRPKTASVTVMTTQGQYTIAGIAKGAGMIAPNMATMLSAVVTDAVLTPDIAQDTLRQAVGVSFNRVVVDGDMSTNDTLLLLANGASGVTVDESELGQFQQALTAVCTELAQLIVRDGEGVTKFITLTIQGAPDDESAHRIANTIATSPLVKTAFFGSDANWGRIVAAAGRAGIDLQPEALKLWITPGEVTQINASSLLLFADAMPTAYREDQAMAIFREPSVSIVLDCGIGNGSATVWTCDLSNDYVSINGDYRS